jgi:hypothetical protein
MTDDPLDGIKARVVLLRMLLEPGQGMNPERVAEAYEMIVRLLYEDFPWLTEEVERLRSVENAKEQ